MKKLYLTLFLILSCAVNSYSQQYIMNTNAGGSASYRLTFYPNGQYYYEYSIKANGNLLIPIKEVEGYLIFDQKPTSFYFYAYRPESYSCSGPCGEDWDSSLSATNFNANCFSAVGGSGGRSGPEIVPEFSIISNQVLTQSSPNDFCDYITLQVTGCSGTQRFFWEYKTADDVDFKPTNVSTTFNQTFQFNKSAYLPSTYSGNIDFRVKIDSDPTITGEEVYSNIIFYNVIPCAPKMIGEPAPQSPLCFETATGKIIMQFDNDLANEEYFSLVLTPIENGFELPPLNKTVSKSEFINRTIIWDDLRAGTYNLKYQTFKTGNPPSQFIPKNNIVITEKSALRFEVFKTDSACNNQNGSIRIEAFGGTSPYFYKIDSNSEVQFTASTSDLSISPGDHSIKVRDTNNCIDNEANE